MWFKWFPWRYIISRMAKSHGFLDPITLLSRLHQFAQPSEVTEPIELLRAGVIFHARGLINSRVIQHNLDWVWPYWIEQQFDPLSEAFVPRSFSITHVNLTHRNWTAVGQPDCDWLPLVDPRGLVTPLYDGWSIDFWILPEQGPPLIPSRAASVWQRLQLGKGLSIETEISGLPARLNSRVFLDDRPGHPQCRVEVQAVHQDGGMLAVALRPANPEGVSFLHQITYQEDRRRFVTDPRGEVQLEEGPDRVAMSNYRQGDVFASLARPAEERPTNSVSCEVGMATAVALYRLPPRQQRTIALTIPAPAGVPQPLSAEVHPVRCTEPVSWQQVLSGHCQLRTPDPWINFLFQAAVYTLILHSPGDVYPGPYTYKRFWFRDAAFILHALLVLGYRDRVGRCLRRFPTRQTRFGYFHSQNGEWDANGEALWILYRYQQLTGQTLDAALLRAVRRGGRWIQHKRLGADSDSLHAGLLPAGFSAEHLGPNDYYYWDDFWSVAGLRAAAAILGQAGDTTRAASFAEEADDLSDCIDVSITRATARQNRLGVPASPYRRMDSGAIGSLVASYPLGLWPPDDLRMQNTTEFLLQHALVNDGFFQDMIHSGINPYLTLHLAQVLLRAGDPRHFRLVESVARLASPTGQWPEAVHPQTGGGCMGDGQHVWAAAEWIMMMRNCFLREEGDRLILGSGIPLHWLEGRESSRATPPADTEPLRCGPTSTPYGPVSVMITPDPQRPVIRWQAAWRAEPPQIEVALPGFERVTVEGSRQSVLLRRAAGSLDRCGRS